MTLKTVKTLIFTIEECAMFGKCDIKCKASALLNYLPPSLEVFSSEAVKQRLEKFFTN